MIHRILILVVLVGLTASVHAQATTQTDPLKIAITGIEGIVQARTAADQPWKKAESGMELVEGAELRTGPRSAVRFTILPDQTITLDRLGTLQILRANFENGKVMTDLGMKYGRTRYDIEAEGRAHDAKVHSPSSVLAIRGTQVTLYDQPPFLPQATSLRGQAYFNDIHKQVAFGGKGKTKVGQENESSADYAKEQTVASPKGDFAGRSQTDNLLQMSLAAYGGTDFSNLGVLAFLDQARAGTFKGSVIGALPIGRQLEFLLFWTGTPFGDVDLSVTSPLGETVSITNPSVASSGQHLGNGVADETGNGTETVTWQISYPPGTYNAKATMKSGTTANVSIFAIDDPLGAGTTLGTITGTATVARPVVQGSVKATKK